MRFTPETIARRHASMRAQLILLVLAVVLPAVGFVAWYFAHESQEAGKAAYQSVRILADNTAASLELILHEHDTVLGRFARQPPIRALDAKRCDPLIDGYAKVHSDFNAVGVADADGNIRCSSVPNPPDRSQVSKLPWFQEGLRGGKFTVSDAFPGRSSGDWHSVLTTPIRDEEGRVAGLLFLSRDLRRLAERVFARSPRDALQVVLDRQDAIVLRSADARAWIGKPSSGPLADAAHGKREGYLSARGDDGVRRLYAFVTVESAGWRVFAGLPEDEVYAAHHELLTHSISAAVAVLLLVLALAWRIGSGLVRPIAELAGTAARIAAGDTGARARVAGPAEIAHVAQQFNRMLDARERQREERAALASHYAQLLRLARDIFLLLGPAGEIVEANEAAVAAYGYGADELRAMNIRDLRAEETRSLADRHWEDSARPEGALFQTVHRRKDGSTFPVEVSTRSIDIGGKLYRQSFIRDISERRAAEEQLLRMNTAYATLSQTNEAIVRARGAEELFPRICRIAVEFGGYLGAWIGLVDRRSARIVPAAIAGAVEDYVHRITISTDPARPEGRGPAALVLREDRPYYCGDFAEDPVTEPWRDLAAEFGIRSLASLPLRRANAVIGTLTLYSAAPVLYDAAMRGLLEEMAEDISFALDTFERERALNESEALFRGMIEQNISAMFMVEEGRISFANRRTAEILGYGAGELSGKSALDVVVESDRPAIAEAIRQLVSGEQKSVERNFGALRKDGTVADIGANALLATVQGKRVILGIAQDIGERKKAQAEIERYIARLEQAMRSTLEAVSLMVGLRDPYTSGHERRVGDLAAAIGAEMGLPEDTVKGLRLTGYVHDLGKISVPAELLSKPSRLTAIEFEIIKAHARSGYDVLKNVDFPWPVAEVILQHHERLDGSGYPQGLKDGDILLEARIVAVADVVEAMSSHRPYRPGLGVGAALEEIEKNSGKSYDPLAVQACLRLFRDQGYVLAD